MSEAALASPPTRSLGSGRAPRLLYAVAWLPYVAAYAVALGTVTGMSWLDALLAALANALPPALLGLAVLGLCRRRPWPPQRLGPFTALHAAAAALYALLSLAGTWALLTVIWRVRLGFWWPERADFRAVPWQIFLALVIYCVLASLAYSLQLALRLREEQARLARARELQSRAELRALRAQLDPHFLFNTLHTLLALVRRDPRAAEDAIELFGDLMRYALRAPRDAADEVLLRDEWRFVEGYLRLERLRLGERLRPRLDAEEDVLDCLVPALCLQPLVENAVRHAVAPRAGGGSLAVTAQRAGDELRIVVEDDGPGASVTELEDSGGLGLRLSRQRLEALHGERGRLEVRTEPGAGFRVTLRLPARAASVPPERADREEAGWRSAP